MSEDEKKVKLSVSLSLSPENLKVLKSNHINLSSLVNTLLTKYIEDGNIRNNQNNENLQ